MHIPQEPLVGPRPGARRLACSVAMAIALCGAAASATTITLSSGTTGSLGGQPFNETHAVDVTVLSPTDLSVTSMTLTGLSLTLATSAEVRARIYVSGTGALVASNQAVFTAGGGPITVPINTTLAAGGSYRMAFCVVSSPVAGFAQGSMFDPAPAGLGLTPYTETSGLLRINGIYQTDLTFPFAAIDAFPTAASAAMPQISLKTPWADLGHALAGGAGLPHLVGVGTLVGGTFVTSIVSNLLPNNGASLIVGLTAINAPFKGGVVVPALDLLFAGLPTGAGGTINLPGTWPNGIPPGFTFYEQYWQKDAAAVHGFSASNAISGTTP